MSEALRRVSSVYGGAHAALPPSPPCTSPTTGNKPAKPTLFKPGPTTTTSELVVVADDAPSHKGTSSSSSSATAAVLAGTTSTQEHSTKRNHADQNQLELFPVGTRNASMNAVAAKRGFGGGLSSSRTAAPTRIPTSRESRARRVTLPTSMRRTVMASLSSGRNIRKPTHAGTSWRNSLHLSVRTGQQNMRSMGFSSHDRASGVLP